MNLEEIFFNGYNPINTTVYGILIGVAVYLVYKLINKYNINIDKYSIIFAFLTAFLCGTIRVLGDLNKLPQNFFFMSPFIYFNIALIGFIIYTLAQKYKQYNLSIIFMIVVFFFSLTFYELKNLTGIISIIFISFVIFLIMLKLSRNFELLKDKFNFYAIFAHLFDATSTFISIDFFNYTEQHFVPLFFINLSGTAFVMYFLKLLVIIPIIIYLEKDKSLLRKLVLLAIIYLGFLTGIRDMLKLGSLA